MSRRDKSNRKNRRAKVIRRDGRACKLCGRALEPEEITLDHIIPRSRDGPNTVANLRVACKGCNNARGDAPDPAVEPALARAVALQVELARPSRGRQRRLRAAIAEFQATRLKPPPAVEGRPLSFEERHALQEQDLEVRGYPRRDEGG